MPLNHVRLGQLGSEAVMLRLEYAEGRQALAAAAANPNTPRGRDEGKRVQVTDSMSFPFHSSSAHSTPSLFHFHLERTGLRGAARGREGGKTQWVAGLSCS